MQKISIWSDVVAVILFDRFSKKQSNPPPPPKNQYIMCHVLCVCVVFVVVLFFQLYAFIILRAHHDHNNIAPCGIIKVFWIVLDREGSQVVFDSSISGCVSDQLQSLTGFCQPLSPPYRCHSSLKNTWFDHWFQAKQAEDLKVEAASGDHSSTSNAAAAASAAPVAKMEVKPQVAESEVSEGLGPGTVSQGGGGGSALCYTVRLGGSGGGLGSFSQVGGRGVGLGSVSQFWDQSSGLCW